MTGIHENAGTRFHEAVAKEIKMILLMVSIFDMIDYYLEHNQKYRSCRHVSRMSFDVHTRNL